MMGFPLVSRVDGAGREVAAVVLATSLVIAVGLLVMPERSGLERSVAAEYAAERGVELEAVCGRGRCVLEPDGGRVVYRVRERGQCWSGRLVSSADAGSPTVLDGCVVAAD